MSAPPVRHVDVLVVGAGQVGLGTAYWLGRTSDLQVLVVDSAELAATHEVTVACPRTPWFLKERPLGISMYWWTLLKRDPQRLQQLPGGPLHPGAPRRRRRHRAATPRTQGRGRPVAERVVAGRRTTGAPHR